MKNRVEVLISNNNDGELIGTVYYNGLNAKDMDYDTKRFATHLSRKADYYFCDPIIYKIDTSEYLTKENVDLLHDNNYCLHGSLPGFVNVKELCETIKLAATNLDINVPFTITNGVDKYTVTEHNVNNFYNYYSEFIRITNSISRERPKEKRI